MIGLRRRRRVRRIRRHLEQRLEDRVQLADALTPGDIAVIKFALEDRARLFAGQPAGEAAAIVRSKFGRVR